MVKIGLFGVGHLGKIHLQQWLQVGGVKVVGFCDPDDTNALQAEQQYGVKRFTNALDLIAACDAVDIATTTSAHYSMAVESLKAGKHIFVEKPLANTLEEAREILRLVEEGNLKCQVGHVERFNPAFLALTQVPKPLFIESHRLAQFTPRGADVSVILDLMIHDLDIILHLVKSPISHISASGVAVISETADIANARIAFENGCVANLTASRISLKKMRKMRLFQRDAYIGVDFLEKKTEIVQLKDAVDHLGPLDLPLETSDGRKKTISVSMPEVIVTNAIHAELSAFAAAIEQDTQTQITAADGLKAMEVAHSILEIIDQHLKLHNV